MRLFFSIDLPEKLKKEIIEFAKSKFNNEIWRWINLDNIHLTISFLGEIEEKNLSEILELENIFQKKKKFEIEFEKIIYGPENKKEKRMIWVKIKENENLKEIKEDIEKELNKKIEFEIEKRKFTPHLTLARIKKNSYFPPKKIELKFKRKISVKEIKLFQSFLNKNGAEYKILKTFELK
jgi:2'-5' RNA ligase